MADKLYVIDGDFFTLTAPSQGHVTWSAEKNTWVLNTERWFNYCGPDMANRGVNMMRWLGWSVWPNWTDPNGYKTNLTPFIQVSDGVFDLTKRNDKYWELAEQMIRIMNHPTQKEGVTAPGITLWMDLAYQYTNNKDDIKFSPWRNNVQGIKDLYDPACWQYFEKYMLEWFKLSKEKGLKIVYGMGNEMGEESLDFCYRMLDVMDRERIWPFAWGIGPEIPSPNGNDFFKKLPKYIDEHNLFMWYPYRDSNWWDTDILRPTHGCCNCENNQGVNVFNQAMEYWAGHPIRWQASDDGCMGGATPRPGVEQWEDMVTDICTWDGGTGALTKVWDIEYPLMAVEHLPDDEPWDTCREEQLKIFEAMVRPYEKYLGKMANHDQFPYTYVQPECQLGETKTETCWDGSTIVTHTCENYKWVPTGNTCPAEPTDCKCTYYLNIHDSWLGIPNFIKCLFGKIKPYCKEKEVKCKCTYYLNIHDSWLGIPNFIKCLLGKKDKYCK